MQRLSRISEVIGSIIYFFFAMSLVGVSLIMLGVAIYDIWLAVNEKETLVTALLNGIGFIVIAMAVFDVSKFLLQEEVFRERELGSPTEARETLTKFLVIIAIAVSLEALVFIFDSAKKDITTLIYPTFLLIAAVLLVVGLGFYQKMSRYVEDRTRIESR